MTDSIIIVAGVGMFVGCTLHSMYRQFKDDQMFKRIMVEIDKEEEHDIEHIIPLCYVEQDGDNYFLYNKKTMQFYVQATSYEGLAERMAELGISVACVKDQDKSMWFVNGRVEELVN